VVKTRSKNESVSLTIIGKVLRPNKWKILALNRCQERYSKLVRWYLSFSSTSKKFLHEQCYSEARKRFGFNGALTQTARDKAVEIMRSFKTLSKRMKCREPSSKRVSIRFDTRCFTLERANTKLTPYWLTLKINKNTKITLPIKFGEKQAELVDSALNGEWKVCTVEMVKRDKEWYAHISLKKEVAYDEPETFIGIDIGEWNPVVAVAVSKYNDKPIQGQFWNGHEIRSIRGKYGHIRRNLQQKKLLHMVRKIGSKESRRINHLLHVISKQVVEYAKRFPKPIIGMENLKGIRESIKVSRQMRKRLHSWPFRKLQEYIKYKANLAGIQVIHIKSKDTSRKCHRCGHVAQVKGREFRCPECGMSYNRDLNAAVNIAYALKRGIGWRSSGSLKLSDEARSVKPEQKERSLKKRGGSPLDKYIEVTVMKNCKVKKKEKRKVKRIRMRRSEWEWLQAVADALFFGLEAPEYRDD